ncbi:MAG: hypothetical protein ACAI37_22710 [Chthoniobacter sp.]
MVFETRLQNLQGGLKRSRLCFLSLPRFVDVALERYDAILEAAEPK